MKVFHCDHCGQLVFFENTACVSCGHTLAYLPDLGVVGSLDALGDGTWESPLPRAEGRRYRLCRRYAEDRVCNWAVAADHPADDPSPLCVSCRLTSVVPDTSTDAAAAAWYRLEVAKRRLVFTLLSLGLPVPDRAQDPDAGLAFEFRADAPDGSSTVLTGHAHGVITINVAEADDVERERRRHSVHEPYRTLLGHVRHESGHYYWDRLIRDSELLERFRARFGDEQADYAEALRVHYATGAPADWPQQFVSAYASAHPWEDWAETWAHYLHMVDALETAAACGLSLRPRRDDEPSLDAVPIAAAGFDQMLEHWFPVTYVLNNLNRGLGQPDAYPFVLAPPALEKLRFVHDVVRAAGSAPDQRSDPTNTSLS
jgi:hypothetical protein